VQVAMESLGLASNTADIERFVAFASEFVDLPGVPDECHLAPAADRSCP
jgi:hypothetical protein